MPLFARLIDYETCLLFCMGTFHDIELMPLSNIIHTCAGEIQCEQPNNSLYTFTGNLIVENQTLPLSPNQVLLRVRMKTYIPTFIIFAICVVSLTNTNCNHTFVVLKKLLEYFRFSLSFTIAYIFAYCFVIFLPFRSYTNRIKVSFSH